MQSFGWSISGGSDFMDPLGYHTKLVELAYNMATANSSGDAETLRRFRTIYRHMAATVDSVIMEMGQGPFGPMTAGMPGMPVPDTAKVLDETENGLESL